MCFQKCPRSFRNSQNWWCYSNKCVTCGCTPRVNTRSVNWKNLKRCMTGLYYICAWSYRVADYCELWINALATLVRSQSHRFLYFFVIFCRPARCSRVSRMVPWHDNVELDSWGCSIHAMIRWLDARKIQYWIVWTKLPFQCEVWDELILGVAYFGE